MDSNATAAAEVESDHDDPRHDLGTHTRLREDAPADRTDEEAVAKTVGDADVTNVFAREEGDGTWTFHVTVEHADVNWYDYADGWDIVLPDGRSYAGPVRSVHAPCSSSAR